MMRRSLAAIAGAVLAMAPAAPANAETVREAQWHLRALGITDVHRITKGAGVTVAVVDTGVDATHPDLRGQVLKGVGIGAAAGPEGGTVDSGGHGTTMAGTIAAKGGDRNRALGVAPAAKILPVRLAGRGTRAGPPQDVAAGIRWAADHGAKVINLSLAADRDAARAEREAVAYALGKDVVVVAATGNRPQGQKEVGSPARIPGVLAVGATDRSSRLWSGSVTGPEVALTAPGVEIATTGSRRAGSRTGYVVPTGTSEATAVVSAAAALVRSKFPNLKAPDVVNRLIKTADDAGPRGRDEEYGFGRLNIRRALTARVPSVSANPLGDPLPGASPTTAAGATGEKPASTTVNWGIARTAIVLIGGLLLVLVVGVILLVVLVSRRRRPATTYPPTATPYPPGYPPPAPPAGPPPPPAQWPGHSGGSD